jgi:hypothetical protein
MRTEASWEKWFAAEILGKSLHSTKYKRPLYDGAYPIAY